MLCIVGLGNPGSQYSMTRHNIGRMVVERFGRIQSIIFDQDPQAFLGAGTIGTQKVRLVLPQTWMNQTGVVVNDLLHRFAIPSQDLIIVYDDLDLNFGVSRIKTRGGAGGHNGVRSILACINTDQFCRLKIGIGHPPPGIDMADYVLSPFSPSEYSSLERVLSHSVDALETLVLDGAAVAMNRFNARPRPETEA